jgi:hypothetical protein
MRHRSLRPLVLAAAVAATLAALPLGSTLSAQDGAPSGLTFRYSDSQGPGCLTVTSNGDDSVGGGTAIGVALAQNGANWSGQGEEWLLNGSTPRTSAIAFWLSDGAGDALFFDGTVRMGVDTQNAQGEWTSLTDPTLSDEWQAIALFPNRPCPGS